MVAVRRHIQDRGVNKPASSRRRLRAQFVFIVLAQALLAPTFVRGDEPSVRKFLTTYCYRCHGEQTQKADRRLDELTFEVEDDDSVALLEEALDAVNRGDMPPDKKGLKKPSDSERRAFVDGLTSFLERAETEHGTSETLLRRLTRYEYNYTLRDLLAVHPDRADETKLFPPDPNVDGFTNVANAQVLSDHQLEAYFEAARRYVDRALVFGRKQPEKRNWHFSPSDFTRSKTATGQVAWRCLSEDETYVDIGHGEPADRRPNAPTQFAKHGVHADGMYRIRVRATAVRRADHPYDPDILRIDTSQKMKLGIWYAPEKKFLEKTSIEGRQFVAAFDLADYETREFETTVWMNRGSIPFINWLNGPGAAKGPVARVMREYHPDGERLGPSKIDALREQGIILSKEEIERRSRIFASDFYEGPRLRVFGMDLEGPLDAEWPPAGHQSIVGTTTDAQQVDVRDTLTQFAQRAFRRPIQSNEVEHYVGFVDEKIASGSEHGEAIKLGLAAILTSPRFLYLDEGNADAQPILDDFGLANRLSYTFWSSAPDATLLAAAANETLSQPNVLLRQTERLLADPRARAFDRHFVDAWLRLDKLGSMLPGIKEYPAYFRNRMEDAMRTETQMFFRHVLDKNLPVTEFLSADYSFINDSLSQLYGLEDIGGEAFSRVTFPSNSHRGGLLGHASILTATANGVETSPVVRGVWVLESLLGTPPPSPPPDVPPIEPDTRGSTTIREQLAKHRSVTACSDCHSKIDPWGFPLEFYDPIGAFRTHYPTADARTHGPKIDGSANLSDGNVVQDASDLRDALVARRVPFTRNLIEKLLTYATGRHTSYRDQEEVDRLIVVAEDGGFRDLVAAVVRSAAFRRR